MSEMQEVPTDELLSFQDFPPVHNLNTSLPSSSHVELNIHKEEIVKAENFGPSFPDDVDEPDSAGKSFWTLEYYQRFFDVDTEDVLDRLLASIIITRTTSLKNQIKAKPDLYGPIWIAITLIFTIAISGNIANYLQHANDNFHWKYNFHLVSYSATAIVLYVSLIPLTLWAFLKWTVDGTQLDAIDVENKLSPLELICIYGYSLFIYIPVSILWTVQIEWFQWLLVLVATILSGSVLVYTLVPTLRSSRHQFLLTLGVLCFHVALAAGFMLYFFHVPNSTPFIPIAIPSAVPANATIKLDAKVNVTQSVI